MLKVVGSSPAFLAKPEVERPACAASRSSAFQIWARVSMPLFDRAFRRWGFLSIHRTASLMSLAFAMPNHSRYAVRCSLPWLEGACLQLSFCDQSVYVRLALTLYVIWQYLC